MSQAEPHSVLQTMRNFDAKDMQQLRQDVALLAAVQLNIMVDQFNTEMRRLPNIHAPSIQCQVTRRHCSPWYSSITLELCSKKRERCQAEGRWLNFHWTDNS